MQVDTAFNIGVAGLRVADKHINAVALNETPATASWPFLDTLSDHECQQLGVPSEIRYDGARDVATQHSGVCSLSLWNAQLNGILLFRVRHIDKLPDVANVPALSEQRSISIDFIQFRYIIFENYRCVAVLFQCKDSPADLVQKYPICTLSWKIFRKHAASSGVTIGWILTEFSKCMEVVWY